jgi:hypothetical protein
MSYVMLLQSFISIQINFLHQNIPKPSLSRFKFEQLYIVKFVLLILNFVGMFYTQNNDTTPSGGFVGSEMHA